MMDASTFPTWDKAFRERPYRKALTQLGLKARLGSAYQTLDSLLTRSNWDGQALAPLSRLAEDLGVCTRTILRHIDALVSAGALIVEHIPAAPRGRRNCYWIMPIEHVARTLGVAADRVGAVLRACASAAKAVVQTANRALSSATQMSPPQTPHRDTDVTSSAGGPFITSNRGTYNGGGVPTTPPPPGPIQSIDADVERLIADVDRRLGLNLAHHPDLAAQLQRDYKLLLRRGSAGGQVTADEWLTVQAYDLSGYGRAYWGDKVYKPLTLVDTRLLWDRRGRPACKPAVAGRPSSARHGVVKQSPVPAPLATLRRIEPERPDDIHPCCKLPREFGFHRFDCPTKIDGAS